MLQFRNIDEKWKSISSVIPLCRDHLEGDMLKIQSFFCFLEPMEKKKERNKIVKEKEQKLKDTCFHCHYIYILN